MNDFTQCSQFIANSIKIYDIVRFHRLFILSVFVLFVNL